MAVRERCREKSDAADGCKTTTWMQSKGTFETNQRDEFDGGKFTERWKKIGSIW